MEGNQDLGQCTSLSLTHGLDFPSPDPFIAAKHVVRPGQDQKHRGATGRPDVPGTAQPWTDVFECIYLTLNGPHGCIRI